MIHALLRETLRHVVVPIVVAGVAAYAVVKAAGLSNAEDDEDEAKQKDKKDA